MAQTATSKTVEFASGVTGALPFNIESSTNYLTPLVQVVPQSRASCLPVVISGLSRG